MIHSIGIVMAGLGPAIHVLKMKTWMPGPRPGMTPVLFDWITI